MEYNKMGCVCFYAVFRNEKCLQIFKWITLSCVYWKTSTWNGAKLFQLCLQLQQKRRFTWSDFHDKLSTETLLYKGFLQDINDIERLYVSVSGEMELMFTPDEWTSIRVISNERDQSLSKSSLDTTIQMNGFSVGILACESLLVGSFVRLGKHLQHQ
jgi:hypothetical protein